MRECYRPTYTKVPGLKGETWATLAGHQSWAYHIPVSPRYLPHFATAQAAAVS
jgi:hypothetical protein